MNGDDADTLTAAASLPQTTTTETRPAATEHSSSNGPAMETASAAAAEVPVAAPVDAGYDKIVMEKERLLKEREEQVRKMEERLRELEEREKSLLKKDAEQETDSKRSAAAAFGSATNSPVAPAATSIPAAPVTPLNELKRPRLDSVDEGHQFDTSTPTSASSTPFLGGLTSSIEFSEEQKKIALNILVQLGAQPEGSWFSLPVDTNMYTDYIAVVKQPMDFSTIQNKVNWGSYPTAEEYINDVRQVFKNCRAYNKPDTPVAKGGNKLEGMFNRFLSKLRTQQKKEAEAKGLATPSPARAIARRESDFALDRPKRAKHEPPPKDLLDKNQKRKVKLNNSLKYCAGVLKDLMSKKYRDINHPFLQAVDWQALGLLDYPNIVKYPMDLGTVKGKLESGQYHSAADFAAEVRLVWSNCMRYNPRENPVHQMAVKLSKVFEEKYAIIPEVNDNDSDDDSEDMEDSPPSPVMKKHSHKHDKHHHDKHSSKHHEEKPDSMSQMQSEIESLRYIIENMQKGGAAPPTKSPFAERSSSKDKKHSSTPSKSSSSSTSKPKDSSSSIASKKSKKKHKDSKDKHKSSSLSAAPKSAPKKPEDEKMSIDQMRQLSNDINLLPNDKMLKVIEIIQRRNPSLKSASGEVEVTIDTLDIKTLRELDRFVYTYVKRPDAPKTKPKPVVQSSSSSDSSDSEDDSGSSSSDSDSDSESKKNKSSSSSNKPNAPSHLRAPPTSSKMQTFASPLTSAMKPVSADPILSVASKPQGSTETKSAIDFSLKPIEDDSFKYSKSAQSSLSSLPTGAAVARQQDASSWQHQDADLKLLNEDSWASLLSKDTQQTADVSPHPHEHHQHQPHGHQEYSAESISNGDLQQQQPQNEEDASSRWSQMAKQNLEKEKERKELEARRLREIDESERRKKEDQKAKLIEEQRLEEERKKQAEADLLAEREAARRARERDLVDDDADSFF